MPGQSINIPFPQQQTPPPQTNFPPQPQTVFPPYPQAPAVAPQTVTVPQNVQVPRNTIQKKISAPKNALQLYGDPTKTDAQQAEIAGDTVKVLADRIEDEVLSMGNVSVANAWKEVVDSGYKPDAISDFLATQGGSLSNQLHIELELMEELAQYKQNLADGSLTADGKTQSLTQIQQGFDDMVAALGGGAANPTTIQTMQQNIDDMKLLNIVGQLTDLTNGDLNQISILTGAVQDGGMPISLVSEIMGVPVVPADPVSDVSGDTKSAVVVLYNPKENGASVNYVLDTHSFTMQAGQKQGLHRTYTVKFRPGTDEAEKSYRLSEGTYEWHRGDDGWDLHSVKPQVTIDNSHMSSDFRYLLNDEEKVVRAGESVDHTSSKPIEIVFDRGDGKEPARKSLRSGTYVVGVDAQENRLDLFREADALAALPEEPRFDELENEREGPASDAREQRIQELIRQMKTASGISL